MAVVCDNHHQGYSCRREMGHPGNHYDPHTQVAWSDAPAPPAPMPIQPGDPSAGVHRVACGMAFPSNTGWMVCTLPGGHFGNHDADPNVAPFIAAATPTVEPPPAVVVQPVAQPAQSIWKPPADMGIVNQPVTPGGANRAPVGADYSQISHIALRLMAETQAEGNERYGVGNWQKGLPLSNLISHAIEHLMKLANGDITDGTTMRQHFGHALWNIEKAAHFYHTRPDLVDLSAMVQHIQGVAR